MVLLTQAPKMPEMLGQFCSVEIEASVTSIGDGAFAGSGLTSVMIPGSVRSIGNSAFFYCPRVAKVTIPASVTNIGGAAFEGCPRLTTIMVDPQNLYYSSLSGVLFDKNQTTLIEFPGGLTGRYAIPESVTSIEGGAFWGCDGLTSVTIPPRVTSIGDWAFEGCNFPSITIPASVTTIGENAFYACNNFGSVYFLGNAPTADASVFVDDDSVPLYVYYLPGTTGWSSTFALRPTALLLLPNPLILNNGSGFGVQSNAFGFTISWATNLSVVVQACTNLANPIWTPLQSLNLTNGLAYFSDPQWTNYPPAITASARLERHESREKSKSRIRLRGATCCW